MSRYDTENIHIFLKDEIIHIQIVGDSITYEMIDEGIKKRNELFGYKNHLLFADIRGAKTFTREARARLSQKDGGNSVTAVAIMINSKTHMLMYNFFSSIYKPPSPTKLFTDEKEAYKWLSKFNINNAE